MQKKSFSGMNCSIAKALDQVGEWWSLLIIRECTQGATRFDEIQRQLGIARNILTNRLDRLAELEIIEKFPLQDRANTEGYRLTKKGEDLYPVLIALMQWGDRWLTKDDMAPTVLVEHATDKPVEQLTVRGKSGRKLSFRDIRFKEGPGAKETTRTLIRERNERVLGL